MKAREHRYGNALCCTAKARAASHADFRENQGPTLLGDQVDFPMPAAPVALDDAQTAAAEKLRAQILRSRAGLVHGSLNETRTARLTPDRMSAGILYVVATPIGNLADASPRALEALREADVIACEDTRVTRTLLARNGIDTPTVALHEHNERRAAGERLHALPGGQDPAP